MSNATRVDISEFDKILALMKSRIDLVDHYPKDFKLKLYSAG